VMSLGRRGRQAGKMTMSETSQEEYQQRANDCIDDATRSTDPKRRGGFFSP
jgi:hypothetical protein